MNSTFTLFLGSLLSGCLLFAGAASGKTWKDKSGKFSVEATLIEVTENVVVLRRADGRQIRVPLVRLSEEDRDFALRAGREPEGNRERVNYLAKLNEKMREGVNPTENIGLKFWQSVGYDSIQDDLRGSYLKQLGITDTANHSKVRFMSWLEFVTRNNLTVNDRVNPLDSRQKGPVSSWLKTNRASLDEIAIAVKGSEFYLPYVNYPGESGVDLSSVDHVNDLKGVCRAYLLRAAFQLEKKDVATAINDLLTCYRLARLFGNGATEVESLSAIGIERLVEEMLLKIIDAGLLTDTQKGMIQDKLRKLPPTTSAAERIKLLPRLALLDWVSRIRDGGPAQLVVFLNYRIKRDLVDPPAGVANSWKPESYQKWAAALQLAENEFQPLAEALALPSKEQAKQELKTIEEETDRVSYRNRYLRHTKEKTKEVAKVSEGTIPEDVTPEDLLKYIAQFLTPDVNQMLADEVETKDREVRLLKKLSE